MTQARAFRTYANSTGADRFDDFKAVRESSLGSSAKLVLLIWLTYADPDGVAYPSVRTLMAGTSLCRTTVQSVLKDLKKIGVLVKIDAHSPGRRGTTCRFHPERLPARLRLGLEGSVATEGSPSEPLSDCRDRSPNPRGSSADPQGLACRAQTVQNRSENRESPTHPTRDADWMESLNRISEDD